MWNKQVRDATLAAFAAMIMTAAALFLYAYRINWALVVVSMGVISFFLVLYIYYRVAHFYRLIASTCLGSLIAFLAFPGFHAMGVLDEQSCLSIAIEPIQAPGIVVLCVICLVSLILDYFRSWIPRRDASSGKERKTKKAGVKTETKQQAGVINYSPVIINPKGVHITYREEHGVSAGPKTGKPEREREKNVPARDSDQQVKHPDQQKQEHPLSVLLAKMGLNEGVEYPLTRRNYKDKVELTLDFTRNELCDRDKVCILGGTTISLPSTMMDARLDLYNKMWKDHGKSIEEHRKSGKYKAIRLICHSHNELRKDVEKHKTLYKLFFDWCQKTHFDVMLLRRAQDYFPILEGNGIELKDFMVYGYERNPAEGKNALGPVDATFVFGSINPITESEIKAKIHISPDELANYEKTLETLCEYEHSIRVDSLKALQDCLGNPYMGLD